MRPSERPYPYAYDPGRSAAANVDASHEAEPWRAELRRRPAQEIRMRPAGAANGGGLKAGPGRLGLAP